MRSHGRVAFWLAFTGLLELGLAAFFLALGLVVPEADFGMFLTAAILGITGVVLLVIGWRVRASAAANERLLREGKAGTATVTGLTQTGMYLNENPQLAIDLLIDIAGREPYPVTRKEFVPLIMLSRLSSGAPLPVRVDRTDPQRVVIDWDNVRLGATAPAPAGLGVSGTPLVAGAAGALAGAGLGAAALGSTVPMGAAPGATTEPAGPAATEPVAGLPFGLRANVPPEATQQLEMMRNWLRQTGQAGTARIDRATDTGVLVGNDRLFTVEATLELPGRAPEKLPPVAAMVAPDDVDKVRTGYRVAVRVAPDNHQLIDFDW